MNNEYEKKLAELHKVQDEIAEANFYGDDGWGVEKLFENKENIEKELDALNKNWREEERIRLDNSLSEIKSYLVRSGIFKN